MPSSAEAPSERSHDFRCLTCGFVGPVEKFEMRGSGESSCPECGESVALMADVWERPEP